MEGQHDGPDASPKVVKGIQRDFKQGDRNMIVAFLYILAVLEVGYGIGVFVRSQDEFLGGIAIGFAILTVGLAGILTEVSRSRELLERLART